MDIKPIPAAIQSGLNGLQDAQRGVAEAAHNIANLNSNDSATVNTLQGGQVTEQSQSQSSVLTTEAVNLVVNEHLAKANIKVIQTADEVLGTLIDTKV